MRALRRLLPTALLLGACAHVGGDGDDDGPGQIDGSVSHVDAGPFDPDAATFSRDAGPHTPDAGTTCPSLGAPGWYRMGSPLDAVPDTGTGAYSARLAIDGTGQPIVIWTEG